MNRYTAVREQACRTTTLLTLATLMACGPSSDPLTAADLTETEPDFRRGCGADFMARYDDAGSEYFVEVSVPTWEPEPESSSTLSVTQNNVGVTLVQGTQPDCTDALTGPGPEDRVYQAAAGDIELSTGPAYDDGGRENMGVVVTLSNLELEATGAETIRIDSWTWEPIDVQVR